MIVKDIDIMRAHVRLDVKMKYESVQPMVRLAQRDYLLPALGPALLAELELLVNGGSPNPAEEKLIVAAQEAGAILAYYHYVPVGQLMQGETGLHALSNDHYKSPYQWQVGDFREEYLLAGYAALENLYQVLEEVRPAAWLSSEAHAAYNDSLLRNATEFHKVYSIGYSRITYVDIKPAMERAQDMVLRPTLGDDFYDSLIDFLANSDDSDSGDTEAYDAAMHTAIAKVRKALAQLTIAHAKEVMFRAVNGSLLSTRFDHNSSNTAKVIDERLHNQFTVDTRKTALDMGMELLALARGWLDRNADTLPLYKQGPGYRPLGNAQRPASERMHNAGGLFMP